MDPERYCFAVSELLILAMRPETYWQTIPRLPWLHLGCDIWLHEHSDDDASPKFQRAGMETERNGAERCSYHSLESIPEPTWCAHVALVSFMLGARTQCRLWER